MLNKNTPPSRPRHFAGATSAIYMGPSTDEPPIPRPPMKRKRTSADQSHATAQPRAETRYSTAIARKLSRRPNLSPGSPARMDPKMVPQSAAETVIPKAAGDRWNVSVSAWVVPAITAVSNPKRSPPSDATRVLFKRYELRVIVPFKISDRFHSAYPASPSCNVQGPGNSSTLLANRLTKSS